MVMTTGALSIGLHYQGFTYAAKVLLGMNILIYVWLWVMTFVRLFKFYPRLSRDVKSHDTGPGFFTLVAGTCVFGSQVCTVTNNIMIPFILWGIGIFSWVRILYPFFTSIPIRRHKPPSGDVITGPW